MSESHEEKIELAQAIEHMSLAMERLEERYEKSQKTQRMYRIVLIVVLLLFGYMSYQAVLPVIDVVKQIPEAIPKLKPVSSLTEEERLLKRKQFISSLPTSSSKQINQFETEHQLMSEYLSLTPEFNSGATVALFLYKMSESMQTMPKMYEEIRIIKQEMQVMNGKMNALPGLEKNIHAMQVQMTSLPVLTNEIKVMNGQIYNMSQDIDSTMGSAGRFIPW